MKRLIALLLAMLMCLSLCACDDDADSSDRTGNKDNKVNAEVDGGNSESKEYDTSWLVSEDLINVAKLSASLEIVELTTENWKEHFKAYHYTYSYDKENVEYDAFGEVVSTETITNSGDGYAFGPGNERYHWFDDVVIELKNLTTGELIVFDCSDNHSDYNDPNVEQSFNLDDYECTRIKGSIYYFDFSIGELPVDTYLWPVFPEEHMAAPGAVYACPGTNAIQNEYMKDWLSYFK